MIKKKTLDTSIQRLQGELCRLNNDLCAVGATDALRYPENFAEATLAAALRGERLTCSLRQLVYTGATKKAEYLSSAASAQGIVIQHQGQHITITLPSLLPKRRGHSSEFLTDPLFFALSEYAMVHQIGRLDHAVVCFIHTYGQEAPTRDYDNIESKQLLDVVAMFTLEDDGGQYCDVYHTTRTGAASLTEIHVMSRASFPKWLQDQAMTPPDEGPATR